MSNKSYQKYVDMVNPDDCGCMYQKRKLNKKIAPQASQRIRPRSKRESDAAPMLLPVSLALVGGQRLQNASNPARETKEYEGTLAPDPSSVTSMQLQQPRRFTRKLYNPNSVSDGNIHSEPTFRSPRNDLMYGGGVHGYSEELAYGHRSPEEYGYGIHAYASAERELTYGRKRSEEYGCGIRSKAEDLHAYSEERGKRSEEYDRHQSPYNHHHGCGIHAYSSAERELTYGRKRSEEYDDRRHDWVPPNSNPTVVVPLLYLDQLIRTREEINRQDRIALSQPGRRPSVTQRSIVKEPSFVSNLSSTGDPVLNKSTAPHLPTPRNRFLSRKVHVHNQPSRSSMNNVSTTQDHVNLFKHNLQDNHDENHKFDDDFLHHIHYLMSFKNRVRNRHPFSSDQDDHNSVIGQADLASVVFNESSSEGRPASLPSVQTRMGDRLSMCVNVSRSRDRREEEILPEPLPSDHGGVSYYSV
jgi:hypothetical protein